MERSANKVNNDLYHTLGERWYHAKDDPVALLRAERRLLVPWVGEKIAEIKKHSRCKVLDVACGAGLFSNPLSNLGHDVTGFDVSEESIKIARQYDQTKQVKYLIADAYQFPFPDNTFDVVCAMDFLEHVNKPELVVKEVARVLKPSGIFFFSTFNANWLAWLIVIKGVEWFVKNTPKNLHVLELFIKPENLKIMLEKSGFKDIKMSGHRPDFLTLPFFQMLFTGEVSDQFSFKFTRSLLIGYSGIAIKF